MTQQPIVVGFDDSPASRAALKWAVGDARGRRGEVLLVHAAKTFPPISPDPGGYVAYPSQITVETGKAVLQTGALLADRLAPEVITTTLLIEDEPAPALLSALDTAALAVVGARGLGGFAELVVGSTSLTLATQARCPVVVVRAAPAEVEPGPEAGRVVVGLESDEAGLADVLGFAFEEAAWRHVGLTAVHAWQERYYDLPGKGAPIPRRIPIEEFQAEERRRLSELVAGWRATYPDVETRLEVVPESAAAVLVSASAAAELLVVGSHRRGPLGSRLLGSVSHTMLHHAHCPVAVIGAPH